jgi:hypothetical protein
VRSVARGAAAVAALALGVGAWTPYAAAETVDLGGQPVEGSTDSATPTSLDAGLWTTMLGPQSQPQYFSYERQIEDSTVHVGVVGTPRTPDYDGIYVYATVETPDDPAVDCGTGDASSDTAYFDAPIGDEVIVGDEDAADDPCHSADTITVKLERYSTSSIEMLPVAIKIVEEAPVTDQGAAIADDAELEYDVPEPVDAADGPQGSDSFDDAPVVDAHDGPVTIAAELTEGTTLLWRVPLDWGDQLVVRGDLPTVPPDGPLAGASAQVRIVQPGRDVFALTKSEQYYYADYGEKPVRVVAASHPLRYGNRFRDFEPTLPGDHWVAVSVERAQDREPMHVSLDLTIAVTHADDAPPTYKDAVLAQGGGPGPDGYSAGTPYLVGDGEFSAVASGNPFASEGDEGDEWWGPRRGVGLGLGVVSLVCCAVGAVWLTRRRAG